MTNNKVVLGLIVIIAIAIGYVGYVNPKVELPQVSFGNTPGPTITNYLELLGGVTYGRVNSTSTTATTQTLGAKDLVGPEGFAYDTVLMTPNVAAVTFTLPASSTLRNFLPRAGQTARQCWVNSTTTAAATIVFAAGTGIDLETASSTRTDLTLLAGNTACFQFIRQKATSAAFDITAAMTEFTDGD